MGKCYSHCDYYQVGGNGLGDEGGARMPPNTTNTLRYEEYAVVVVVPPVGNSMILLRFDAAFGMGAPKGLEGMERRKLSG